jgi:hypothetical protein
VKLIKLKKFLLSALFAPMFAAGWLAGVITEFTALQIAALAEGFHSGRGKKGGDQ